MADENEPAPIPVKERSGVSMTPIMAKAVEVVSFDENSSFFTHAETLCKKL